MRHSAAIFSMYKKDLKHCYLWILFACALPLAACTTNHVELGTQEHAELIQSDIAQIESSYPQSADENAQIQPAAGPIHLTLKEALHRGVMYNLDARVAAMEALVEHGDISLEKLKALPAVNVSGSLVGRSNDGGTSSRSVLSGQQSLEPSQSTEENRRTADLEVTWNLIDAALAISESQTAKDEEKIARKRYDKIAQNIQRDVYFAYWKALAYQSSQAENEALLRNAEEQIEKIEMAQNEGLISSSEASEKTSALSARYKELSEIQNQLALSEIELKSLLSLPLDAEITLSDKTDDFTSRYRALLKNDIEDLEWEALTSRPEMDEEILKKNIAWRNTRHEIIKTFPGLELFLSASYDSNQFLEDPNWGNYRAKILQSVTALFTAQSRIRKSKNEESLADVKRQTLALAIMAQARIARHRLQFAERQYNFSKTAEKAAAHQAFSAQGQRDSGFISGEQSLGKDIEKQIKTLELSLAEAQLQDAYAAFAVTLGRELSPVSANTGGRS